MSPGDIKMAASDIIAPRVGVCGSNIQMIDATIDTSWKGCPRDQGFGSIPEKRVGDLKCAGAGASHGGAGGTGGITSNDENE